MNRDEVLQNIEENIKSNGKGEITGQKLQDVLKNIANMDTSGGGGGGVVGTCKRTGDFYYDFSPSFGHMVTFDINNLQLQVPWLCALAPSIGAYNRYQDEDFTNYSFPTGIEGGYCYACFFAAGKVENDNVEAYGVATTLIDSGTWYGSGTYAYFNPLTTDNGLFPNGKPFLVIGSLTSGVEIPTSLMVNGVTYTIEDVVDSNWDVRNWGVFGGGDA